MTGTAVCGAAKGEIFGLVFAFASGRIGKYHCWPFLVWCISGSRSPLAFLVDDLTAEFSRPHFGWFRVAVSARLAAY